MLQCNLGALPVLPSKGAKGTFSESFSRLRLGADKALIRIANLLYDVHSGSEESGLALNRDEVLLVILALADGKPLTPVQIQKSLFLADDKASGAFRENSRYHFEPYDYGPFDRHVYTDAQVLAREGLVEIATDPRGWNTYAATPAGVRRGAELGAKLAGNQRDMLVRIVGLVRKLSFADLVSAIYRKYPHMKARSVFRD